MISNFRFIAPLLLLIFCSFNLSAQNTTEVRILSSSSLVFETADGEQVQKIIDAEVSAENFKILADSAVKFINKNEFQAFGNIQIETNNKMIWADSLFYFTDRDYSRLRGRVIIETDSSIIYSPSVDYLFSLEIAQFAGFVRLKDENGILTAKQGSYFQLQDSAVFRNEVQLVDSTQYAEGDSITFNRSSRSFAIYGNVFAYDSTNNTLLKADFISGDSTGNRSLIGDSYLRSISSDTTDTTHINAEEIYVRKVDEYSEIRSYQDVEIWTAQFSSLSDTSVYNEQQSTFELISNPKAWHDNIQLSGPYIRVDLDSTAIERLFSYPNPIAVQADSSTNRLNQITGDTLLANFSDNRIQEIIVYPKNTILFHSKNEEDESDGAIEFNALDKTTMYFSESGLDSVKSLTSIDGLYIPEEAGSKDRKLKGFIWNPELKPLRPMLVPKARFKPIDLTIPFSLPQRYVDFKKDKN